VSEHRSASRGPRPLIWIADDSPTEALITERSLGPRYDFEWFGDGSAVVERLAAGAPQPDLVLLDWVMPGMNGDEVCRFLRTHPPTLELPVILVTASRVETSDVVCGLAAGANDYVARPFAAEELRARVESALRAKQLSNVAQRERRRLSTVNQLGRALFAAGTDIDQILDELATSLTVSICDGCSILLLPGTVAVAIAAVTRHNAEASGEALAAIATVADPVVYRFETSVQAREALAPAYAAYIGRFGLRGLAIMPFPSLSPIRGIVTMTRDGGSDPFDADDIATIQTCIEYAGLAVENAARFAAETAERERTAQFQQQMIAIVGHDLRNPLSAIVTGTELLAMQTRNNPVAASVLKRVSASTDRMIRMVDQLLDVTRAQLGGGIPVVRRETRLVPLIQSVIDELSLAYVKARFELVAPLDVVGEWDPDRLAQVVSNVVSNAVQYGREGAPIVIAVSRTELAAVVTVHNAIRDQPIRAEALATLFTPYRRGHDTGSNATGLGLGLYIVHEIVRAHAGTIEVESSPSGTTVRVVLPTVRPSTT
jgi:signal transduction histidine kinase